uniref:Peptidyl-prolyl cis-trans isomerase FKBP16-1ic isoform X1 n=1 Tax=Rhizophora mucronata TaxID=61149 RepID=A0A2P2MDH7_RHIMU
MNFRFSSWRWMESIRSEALMDSGYPEDPIRKLMGFEHPFAFVLTGPKPKKIKKWQKSRLGPLLNLQTSIGTCKQVSIRLGNLCSHFPFRFSIKIQIKLRDI